MTQLTEGLESTVVFPTVSPASFQQYVTLLLDRVIPEQLPELAGMMRVKGRWANPGKPYGKFYYSAQVSDDGGAQVKIEIPLSLVDSRGVQPGQQVIVTGRLVVKSGNHGIEVKLSATDIELGQQEEAAQTAVVQQGRMSLERLRSINLKHVPFPDQGPYSIALIQSTSASAQVSMDCMAELDKLGSAIDVVPRRINMLDPVAIAKAISESDADDIVMIIRGGGDAADFEVFDDPRVVFAMANQRAHRVVGLGHSGNATLLDLLSDFSANTPAQAGQYVRERIQRRQQLMGDAAKDLRAAKERMDALEKERNMAQAQMKTANEQLELAVHQAQAGMPLWAVVVAFVAGAVLVWVIR